MARLANSVKLRLAMRICYVKPDLAKQYAMEAVRDGVMEKTADDSALFQSWGSITVINPLEKDLERLQRHPHGRFDGLLSQRLQRPASSGLFPARYRR